MIERVVTVLGDRPKGTALVVAGDLNTDLKDSENDRRGTDISEEMTAVGVEDMTAHFLPRKRNLCSPPVALCVLQVRVKVP